MKKTKSRLNAEQSKLLTRVMTMGSGTALPVSMSEAELSKLIGVIYSDIGVLEMLEDNFADLRASITPPVDSYYEIPDAWFEGEVPLKPEQHIDLMLSGMNDIEDFTTYLSCLSELHKRRRKYSMILAAQPMPTMIQVSPRALIEYGCTDTQALASWLTWRKFFYDLDNRAAQETGYLFEPILAAALGGERKSDKSKVVTRTSNSEKGRQVDCWKVLPDGTKLAYEFKLRVTIAASGQGRFAEEIQFAVDAKNSGARPILIVLDPTMNPRLDDLQTAFRDQGGEAYLGEDAWNHLEEEAGDVMSRFIDRYVHEPIKNVSEFERSETGRAHLALLDFGASYKGSEVIFTLGGHVRSISRQEVIELADDSEDEP